MSHKILFGAALLFVALLGGCYDDVETLPPLPPDTTPPVAISQESLQLTAERETPGNVLLRFAAPGDLVHKKLLAVARYEFAIAQTPLTPTDQSAFLKARLVKPAGAPKAPGETESVVLDGLMTATDYYVGLRSFDAAGNASLITVGQVRTYDPSELPPPEEMTLLNTTPSPAMRISWRYVFTGKGGECTGFVLTRRPAATTQDTTLRIPAQPENADYSYLDQDPSLVPGLTYTYTLTAQNAAGETSSPQEGAIAAYACLDGECHESGFACAPQTHICRSIPVLTTIAPSPAEIGETLTLSGSALGTTGQAGETLLVHFDGSAVEAASSGDATRLNVVVPALALSSDELQDVSVTVSVAGLVSNAIKLPVHPFWPRIERLTPDVVAPGATVRLDGRHFTLGAASSVRVFFATNTCFADVTPSSDTQLSLALPACAASGPVTLTVGGKPSRGPAPELVVVGSRESQVTLAADPPRAFGLSPDGGKLLVLTPDRLAPLRAGARRAKRAALRAKRRHALPPAEIASPGGL